MMTHLEITLCTNAEVSGDKHFPNDRASDAVMLVHIKKDGLLWRTETGSTPLGIVSSSILDIAFLRKGVSPHHNPVQHQQ